MNEKSDPSPSSTSGVLNAAANLAKAVPVYDDALKPLALETGKALGTVGKVVNTALMPVRGMVWGAGQIEDWVSSRVSKKLEKVPKENIVTPDLSIAGPTIEALKFNGHKAELSEMFAGLMAGAMNSQTRAIAHPTFVEKIKSLTAIEARIFAAISSSTAIPTLNIL